MVQVVVAENACRLFRGRALLGQYFPSVFRSPCSVQPGPMLAILLQCAIMPVSDLSEKELP
ncbi:hypothetical protein X750_09900 [Mesorhizobium sp. LNJC394B00]|nr:hypothetical protein X750_09900 [Mesorhizobium sp. LNJC394B00]ESZ76437.1 hypothetical protein X726_11725 [Mesorhizobium sp. L103C105A0]